MPLKTALPHTMAANIAITTPPHITLIVELPNIAAYAEQDVHAWSALLTCLRPTPHLMGCQGGWLVAFIIQPCRNMGIHKVGDRFWPQQQ